MTSPTPAVRRLDPPSTLMHCTRLAPILSATSRLDCIWIIDPVPSQSAFRDVGLNRPGSSKKTNSGSIACFFDLEVRLDRIAPAGAHTIKHFPGLGLRNRAGLLDPHGLARLEFIAL